MSALAKTSRRAALAMLVSAPVIVAARPALAATNRKQPAPPPAPAPIVPLDRPTFTAQDQDLASIPGFPDARFWGDSEKDFLNAVAEANGPWLALSAGGEEGAFGAGLLAGLSATGRRPDFAVVTGVSTGALMAPYAFLGASHDEVLRKTYTTITAADIFELGSTGESLLDTWPLKKLIESKVTPALLAEIASEHRKGRRLLVVTVNLDAGRPVVWNMGAIAARGGDKALKLFQQVLLASSSIPGAFQPVLIDVQANGKSFREMHADGGIHAPFYVAPESVLAGSSARLPATQIFVVVNGKLSTPFQQADRNMLAILARSIAVALQGATRREILRVYATAKRQEIAFNLATIAPDFAQPNRGPFDAESMRALFDLGLKQGQSSMPFLAGPPSLPNTSTASLMDPATVVTQ